MYMHVFVIAYAKKKRNVAIPSAQFAMYFNTYLASSCMVAIALLVIITYLKCV